MNSQKRLDRDLITEVFMRLIHAKALAPERNRAIKAEDFQLALASKNCYSVVKNAILEEFRSVLVGHDGQDFQFMIYHHPAFLSGLYMPKFLFWRINEDHFRELTLSNFNGVLLENMKKYDVLCKILGYGLEKIEFEFFFYVLNSIDDVRPQILRLINEAGKKLKELIFIPQNFLCHLPSNLELRNITTQIDLSLDELAKKYDVEKFLNISTQLLNISSVETCLLFTPWLKNVKATCLDLDVKNPVFHLSLIDQATNHSIKVIRLDLKFYKFPSDDFDFTTLMINLKRCYLQTIDVDVEITFYVSHYIADELEPEAFLHLAKGFFSDIEVKMSEWQSFPYNTCKLKIVLHVNYCAENFVSLIEASPLIGFERSECRDSDGDICDGWKKTIEFGANKSMTFMFLV